MLDVAGGVYFEFCLYPHHRALLGSGGRSALALANLSDGVTLHTLVEPRNVELLSLQIGSSRVRLANSPAATTPAFSYLHTLSNPDIRGVPKAAAHSRIAVKGDNVLRFGMIDGTAVVHGRKVVYDPQTPDDPEPFEANGSTAESLAYVCNANEALGLTRAESIEQAGEMLVAKRAVDAVVVKAGPWGAHWFSKQARGFVPATPTATVFKIGSGDVFSAAFAHCWAEREMSVGDSVMRASQAAAYYCRNRSLPLPQTFGEGLVRAGQAAQKGPIYLAAPFFTISQRWLLEETRSILLDMGSSVFSPLHDVGRGDSEHVAKRDLEGLRASASVLALLDELDTGTVFEIGYARSAGKAVVGYAERLEEKHATMLVGTGCEVVTDYASAVYRAIWSSVQ